MSHAICHSTVHSFELLNYTSWAVIIIWAIIRLNLWLVRVESCPSSVRLNTFFSYLFGGRGTFKSCSGSKAALRCRTCLKEMGMAL